MCSICVLEAMQMISQLICTQSELFHRNLFVNVIVQVVDSACGSDAERLWIQNKDISVKVVDSMY